MEPQAESTPPMVGVDVLPQPLLDVDFIRVSGRAMPIRAIDDVLQFAPI
jgi:hypothetical protein